MIKKKLFLLGGLAAAVTIPIAASRDGIPALKEKFQSAFQGKEEPATELSWEDSAESTVALAHPHAIAPPSLAGPRTGQLHTYFDFRITPTWVTSHWTRVSTELAEMELEGMRVPVVTGTGVDDLHGSMTYYFNNEQTLERISFYGYTGDPSKLIALVTKFHQFQPTRSLSGNFYTKLWNKQPVGALWIESTPIVTSDTARARYLVKLEINSTLGAYKMSNGMASFVKQQSLAGRWSYH